MSELLRRLDEVFGSQDANFAAPVLSCADARDGTPNTRPLTEYGNARRLLDRHGERFRYVFDVKQWLIWRGDRWQWDSDGAAVRQLAAELPERIYAEGLQHLKDAGHFAKWARASQSANVIGSVVSLAKDFQQIRLPLSHVDANPMLTGLDSCKQVLDLRTGQVRKATQFDYVTKTLGAAELGEPAKASRWNKFLKQVFDDDAEIIDWLRRFCGYALTGLTSEQFFLFCFGLGANGKSVFAETLKHVMGDYARAVAAETLTETRRQGGGATPDLAALIGSRMALCTETEDGQALAESLVKSLVSGDSMTARPLYCPPVEFAPQFKLVMLGNHRPIVRGADFGMWRRIRLLPFAKTFGESERDPQLLSRLKDETPHILAWMVDGCLNWQQRGLADVPRVIADATADYRKEQDIFGQWLSECCTVLAERETDAGELYRSYREWAFDNGLKPGSTTSFGRRLGERGFARRQSNGKRLWQGIALGVEDGGSYRRYSRGF